MSGTIQYDTHRWDEKNSTRNYFVHFIYRGTRIPSVTAWTSKNYQSGHGDFWNKAELYRPV